MDIRKIEYFLKVAETLNFSKAAAQMHISHQALSKQIQLLEDEIGVPLLERSTKRVALTEVGLKVLTTFRPLMRELEQGYKDVLEFVKYKKDTLRIGYFNGLSYSRIVSPVVRKLEEQAPHLRIDMLATDVSLVKQLLEQDSIDLAIFPVFGEYKWRNIIIAPILTSPTKIIVSEQHPWYHKAAVTPEMLAEGTLLVYENRPLEGEDSFLPNIGTKNRLPVHNFDTYMSHLRRGEAFGIVGTTYSRREGQYKLFNLPQNYQSDSMISVAYKPLHPLKNLLQSLNETVFPAD